MAVLRFVCKELAVQSLEMLRAIALLLAAALAPSAAFQPARVATPSIRAAKRASMREPLLAVPAGGASEFMPAVYAPLYAASAPG